MGKIITTLHVVWLVLAFLFLTTNESFSYPLWVNRVFRVLILVVSLLHLIRMIRVQKRQKLGQSEEAQSKQSGDG